jgi:hypothetical protein
MSDTTVNPLPIAILIVYIAAGVVIYAACGLRSMRRSPLQP